MVGGWLTRSAPLKLRSFPRDKLAQPCPRPAPKALTQLTESDRVHSVREVSRTPTKLGRSGRVPGTQLVGP